MNEEEIRALNKLIYDLKEHKTHYAKEYEIECYNSLITLQQENTQLKQQLKDKDEKISKVKEYCIYRQNLTIQSFGTDESKDVLKILESNKED